MKKIILTFIAVALGTVLFALPALATTTVSLVPATLKTAPGQQFNVVVAVNPQGFSNDAEKIEVDYPANLLQVSSFTMGGTWIALTESGYDLTDNTNGVLIKTAGYPRGISTPTMFGTILFTAEKAGSGKITIGSQSVAFQTSGQSAITGTGSSFIVTGVKTVVPKKSETIASTTVSSVNGQALGATATPSNVVTAVNSQVATVSTVVSRGNGDIWISILVLVIVILVIFSAYLVFERKNRQK
jgi:hypothetical protein